MRHHESDGQTRPIPLAPPDSFLPIYFRRLFPCTILYVVVVSATFSSDWRHLREKGQTSDSGWGLGTDDANG